MFFTIILQLLVLLSYRWMSHKRLKQHYKELNEARQHTRDALAIRQAFVNTMAEQLKTPISSLFHYARLMNSPNCPFDHEQRIHVLTEIKGAARTIDRMLNPVLSSYINKSEGISDEHKLRCQEALRSPLHALIGLTELASEGMDNNISEDDMTSMRYTMSNEAFMVAMATQQIILFSATDEYTEIPRPDHIALNEMVQSLVSDYDLRNQSLTKKFESSIIDDVAIQTGQTIPTIRKESESLSQASNSIKKRSPLHIRILDVVEHDVGPLVGAHQFEPDVPQPQAVDVAGKQPVGRRGPRPARLRIVGALLAVGLLHLPAPAPVLDADVGERHVADGGALHARDDDARQRVAVVGHHIIDIYIAGRADIRPLLRPTVAAAGGDVDGIVMHVAHRDVAHHDVLHPPLVHLLECQARAPHAGAVGDGDVAVAAVRLGAQFDAPAHPVHLLGHVTAVEEGAQLVARHQTVRDQDMLAEHGALQGIRRLEHDGVVGGRIHLRVAHGEVLAAVDVDAVAVGVDDDVVDGADVAAGGDDGEVAAPVDGDVADEHVAAELQGYRLVARADGATLDDARLLGVVLRQALTVDHPLAGDGYVRLPLGPYQAVVEVGVASVLILGESAERLALVVGLHRGGRGEYLGAGREVQVHVALQPDAAREVDARGQQHLSAAAGRAGLDGAVDGTVVERESVALGPVVAHVKHSMGPGAHHDHRCNQ